MGSMKGCMMTCWADNNYAKGAWDTCEAGCSGSALNVDDDITRFERLLMARDVDESMKGCMMTCWADNNYAKGAWDTCEACRQRGTCRGCCRWWWLTLQWLLQLQHQ